MTTAPDWRSLPGLLALAEATGKEFSQTRLNYLWDACEGDPAKRFPALLMVAILPQEGTLSFNTSAENRAADGGHGIEPNWELDVQRAVALVRGKLALYQQAVAQGFVFAATSVMSPASGVPVRATGSPFEWLNWHTAILDPDGTVRRGVYALHGSWWVGVRANYLRMGGSMADLEEACRRLDALAPRVAMEFRMVTGDVGWASNWNGTAPEPAAVCTSARITAPAPPAPSPGFQRIPVRILDGRTVYGELRGQTTWIPVGRNDWRPVREVAAAIGADVTPIDFADPERRRVEITAPSK